MRKHLVNGTRILMAAAMILSGVVLFAVGAHTVDLFANPWFQMVAGLGFCAVALTILPERSPGTQTRSPRDTDTDSHDREAEQMIADLTAQGSR